MYPRFRERGVQFESRSDQHVRPVRADGVLCPVRQSSDQEDVRRVQPVTTLAVLHDRFQQLREPNVVAVGNDVRGRAIPQPGQPHPAFRYVRRLFCRHVNYYYYFQRDAPNACIVLLLGPGIKCTKNY